LFQGLQGLQEVCFSDILWPQVDLDSLSQEHNKPSHRILDVMDCFMALTSQVFQLST